VTERFLAEMARNGDGIRERGMGGFAETWGRGPTRIQLELKQPDLFRAHLADMAGHSALGAANTIREIQGKRPSYFDLTDELRALPMPTLIVTGDEDDLSLEASILLKRCIAPSGLAVLPKTGHLVNLEDPARFNALVEEFLDAAGAGTWTDRRDDAAPPSIWGPAGEPGQAQQG